MSLDIWLTARVPTVVFSAKMTHNLHAMAEEAGLYKYLWQPGEVGILSAGMLIEPLRAGLALLKADPARFRQFTPKNGWGDYEGLVRVVEEYLQKCEEFPEAEIRISR